MMTSCFSKGVREHYVREVVGFARSSFLEECSGKDVRKTEAEYSLRRDRIGCLDISFLPDSAAGASICNSCEEGSGSVIESIMRIGEPPRVIAAGHRQLLRRLQFDSCAAVLDVFPS